MFRLYLWLWGLSWQWGNTQVVGAQVPRYSGELLFSGLQQELYSTLALGPCTLETYEGKSHKLWQRLKTSFCHVRKNYTRHESSTKRWLSYELTLLFNLILIKNSLGASLVAQWLRICLPVQGTRVRALVWEDPTCRGTAGPMSHNYWACTSGACAPQQERPQ